MGLIGQMVCDAGNSGTQFTPTPPSAPRAGWGFCTIRSILSACRRRVAALMLQFPPFGGGEVAVRGGVAPTVQTSSTKNADNGLSWARQSALWPQRCPAWCVARTRTRDIARKPAIPCLGGAAHARISGPTLALAGPGADQRAHVRGVGPTCELAGPRARGCTRVSRPAVRRRRSGPTCALRAHILGAVSHAIRLSELSTAPTNVAIPTMQMCNSTQVRGNCMRHSRKAHPTGVTQCRRQRSQWRSR